MNNGVKFDDKHSITDWDLLMVSKNIEEAEPRINTIEIKGRNGSIDLTEALGAVKYNDRTLSFDFEIINPIDYWATRKSISNYLNGRKAKIILDQDPNYYYYGRCQVSDAENEKNVGRFTIECICEPYKMKKSETIVSDDVVAEDIITLSNEKKLVMPKIEATGNIVFKFEDKQFSIAANETFQSPDFILKEGNNQVEIISGSGTLKFTYREGSL